jgi:hypothetical protein
MNKYAVILIEHFTPDMVEDYSIVSENEVYVLIEYTTEPDPTNEHWVIFSGECANVKCSEYLATLNEP